jgi:hypothetical protein
MIALVGYAAIFLALMIAMATANRSDNRRGGSAFGSLGLGFARLLGDALFWTFHPFSPFYVDPYRMGAGRRERSAQQPDIPFYEKVNRFVFGPTERPEDPLVMERKVIGAIRAGKGRVGLADVMRVTGLPRSRVDAMMARLMLDYEGTVEVSDDGGIYYVFQELRRTAQQGEIVPSPRPAWELQKKLAPLTGNSGGANVAIGLLNLFNLVASMWAIENHFTIGNVYTVLTAPPHVILPPLTGLPIALGIVPLVMSIAMFLLPIGRSLWRSRQARAVARENGRLALLREVITRTSEKKPVTDRALTKAWRVATGSEPDSKTITREVVELGGDVDLEASEKEGGVRYRFVDLETEAAALEEERAEAPEEEKRVGKIVFDTN